jgi:hypothetical protein
MGERDIEKQGGTFSFSSNRSVGEYAYDNSNCEVGFMLSFGHCDLRRGVYSAFFSYVSYYVYMYQHLQNIKHLEIVYLETLQRMKPD